MNPRSSLSALRALGASARAAALALLVAAASAPPAGAVEVACATTKDHEALALVNAERAALGRAPLAIDVRLTAAALRHTEDMRDHCFLSHTGSDGSTAKQRMADAGYPNGMGEVAASGSSLSPELVVGAWMNSSGHRAILTNENARHLGLGFAARSTNCSAFWVGNTGNAPDSDFLDALCCSEPGGTPQCVPEPGAAAAPAAALAALAALVLRRDRIAARWSRARSSPANASAS